jgi:hypothetical protein
VRHARVHSKKNKMSPFWRAARARLRVRMLWSMLFFRWAPKEILLCIPWTIIFLDLAEQKDKVSSASQFYFFLLMTEPKGLYLTYWIREFLTRVSVAFGKLVAYGVSSTWHATTSGVGDTLCFHWIYCSSNIYIYIYLYKYICKYRYIQIYYILHTLTLVLKTYSNGFFPPKKYVCLLGPRVLMWYPTLSLAFYLTFFPDILFVEIKSAVKFCILWHSTWQFMDWLRTEGRTEGAGRTEKQKEGHGMCCQNLETLTPQVGANHFWRDHLGMTNASH